GVIRGLAKGAKREKSPFSGGFDVGTRGQIVAIVKTGAELANLTAWTLLELFPPIHQSLHANRSALYMLELVQFMMHDHDPHPRAFDALLDAMRVVGQAGRRDRELLRFQWILLEETGYRPELNQNLETGLAIDQSASAFAFSPAQGGLVTDSGFADRWRVRRETIDTLRRLSIIPEKFVADEETLRRANRLLAAYARHILGREGPALRWAFPDLEA
ncbi:MAG TPA: DNA repair protein RecO, partial [Phycisphaerales bacterium]|nr:DNA repair protein RecO [Phycisphaerales bacterium]